ncbi:hypothetical protein C1N81_00535 (plasmid) [Streptomyces sp. SGAir0957]
MVRAVERAAQGDEAGLPSRLCRALCEGLDVAGASMSLLTHTEARQVLGASGREALRLEELQFETGQGRAWRPPHREVRWCAWTLPST